MTNVVHLRRNGEPTKASVSRRRPNRISHSAADKAYQFTEGKDPVLIQLINMIEESGFSANYIALKADVSVSTIHNWIGGKTSRPQNATMDRVMEAIGFSRKIVAVPGRLERRREFKAWLKDKTTRRKRRKNAD